MSRCHDNHDCLWYICWLWASILWITHHYQRTCFNEVSFLNVCFITTNQKIIFCLDIDPVPCELLSFSTLPCCGIFKCFVNSYPVSLPECYFFWLWGKQVNSFVFKNFFLHESCERHISLSVIRTLYLFYFLPHIHKAVIKFRTELFRR
jgi:hypothetical protein